MKKTGCFPKVPFSLFLAKQGFALLLMAFTVASIPTMGATDKVDSTKAQTTYHVAAPPFHNVVPAGTSFTEIVSLTGVIYGGMAWGDYDNDNDLDVVVTGNQSDPNSPIGFTKLYQNNGGVFTEDTNNVLQQLATGSVDWADYDRDGDIDLLLTGTLLAEPTRPSTFIYTNENGILSELPGTTIPGVGRGSCHWVDWDNDGDLDIFVTGWTYVTANAVSYIAKFYRNNNGTFEAFPYNVQSAHNGDVAWNDVDGDRDFDLLVTGDTDYTQVWLNNVESPFSTTGSLEGLSGSSAAWGDFDNDGDQDLIISGTKFNSNVGTVILYKNGPTGLVSAGASGLIAHYDCSMSTADYDNDGDLDVLLTGFRSPGSPTNTSLFDNDGTGNFVPASSTGLTTPVRDGESVWGDYDHDGDLDSILCGSNVTWDARYVKIYRNDLNTTNTAPSAPTGLTSSQTETEVIFSWNASTDPQGGSVSYNLRIGTTPGGSEIMSASSDLATGYHRIAKPGNVKNGRSWLIKNLSASNYYWSVQAIDNGGLASSFSTEASTVIQLPASNFAADPGHQQVTLSWTNSNTTGHFVIYRELASTSNPTNIIAANATGTSFIDSNVTNGTQYYYYIKAEDSNGNSSALATTNAMPGFFTEAQSLTEVQYGSSAWGDYDADGDYDVVVTGNQPSGSTVEFFRNTNGTFAKESGPALVSGTLSYASWNDYDNDNDLDLLVTGTGEPASNLYKNTSGVFSIVSNANIPKAGRLKHAWADFDNDGDRDVGVSGDGNRLLIKNENKSTFKQVAELSYSLTMAWGDPDNDGDMDYATRDGLFENVDGTFTLRSPFSADGALAWADTDNDGDLDLVGTSFINGTKVLTYRNDGGVWTAVEQPAIVPYYGTELSPASISPGDFDSDGDLDLLITGYTVSSPYTTGAGIYVNNGSGIFSKEVRVDLPQANGVNASWADYDNDGDLDVLLNGSIASVNSSSQIHKILRNNLNPSSQAPTVPGALQAEARDSKITFSWNASTDADGGPISYNLRVGTTPGGSDVMSAMANTTTGKLLVPEMGNVQLNRSWTLNGIAAGTYYWSVQAVDGTYRSSVFAAQQQITLSAQTITFAELEAVSASQSSITLNATASSGLPVVFTSSDPLVATISGNTVTILTAGTTTITASQPGNNSFAAATPVARLLTVNKSDQTITFAPLADRTIGEAPFTLSATASSALPVVFSTTSDKVTLDGNTVTMLKAGSVTIMASQAGNASYLAATPVANTFCINPAKPTITLSGAGTENSLLTSSANGGNQWYLDGTAIAGATQATWSPQSQGIYTVRVTVDGCQSALSDPVSLVVTGIAESNASSIKVHPNPATSRLFIELPNGNEVRVLQLLQMNGSLIRSVETTQKTVEWNIDELPAGPYILRVRHADKFEHLILIKQ